MHVPDVPFALVPMLYTAYNTGLLSKRQIYSRSPLPALP